MIFLQSLFALLLQKKMNVTLSPVSEKALKVILSSARKHCSLR